MQTCCVISRDLRLLRFLLFSSWVQSLTGSHQTVAESVENSQKPTTTRFACRAVDLKLLLAWWSHLVLLHKLNAGTLRPCTFISQTLSWAYSCILSQLGLCVSSVLNNAQEPIASHLLIASLEFNYFSIKSVFYILYMRHFKDIYLRPRIVKLTVKGVCLPWRPCAVMSTGRKNDHLKLSCRYYLIHYFLVCFSLINNRSLNVTDGPRICSAAGSIAEAQRWLGGTYLPFLL